LTATTRSGETPDNSRRGDAEGNNPGFPSDLLSALSGLEANRERVVAHRTRRVVASSIGVLKERRQDKSRVRAMAIGLAIVSVVLITPLLWEAVDSLIAGEHVGDPGNQLALWACIVCPALIAAAVVAGWWRKQS
jgi:hypothetical protein